MSGSRGLGVLIKLTLALSVTARAGEFEAQYQARLTQLDHKRPESVCKARDTLRALLPKSFSSDRESMFRAFLKFNVAVAADSGEDFDAAITPVLDEAFSVLENAR